MSEGACGRTGVRAYRGATRQALLAAALGVALSGCTTLDNAVGAIPWFTTMRDQAVTRPFEAPPGATAPRTAPPGSVPITGVEESLDVFTSELKEIMNPVARDTASLARGRRVYLTYCSVCHGVEGNGDGTVAQKLGYVPPLTMDMTRQRSDGYLYAMIRQGRGLMPRYGDKIRGAERWHVVNYVRQLQEAVGSGQ